jgi:DNA-binding GntR family transcriptional regulator
VEIFKDSFQSQIYDFIKAEILEQNFKFGEQINPKVIAHDKDISVTPVRDALLQLTREGLVINKERVGFFVRNFTCRDIVEIMQARKMYELYNLHEQFDEINRNDLIKIYKKIKSPETKKSELYTLDAKLHDLFIVSSNNRFLRDEYERIKSFFVLFMYYDTSCDQEASQEHCRIIEAILNNEKTDAIKYLRAHLDRVEKVIISNDYFNKTQESLENTE